MLDINKLMASLSKDRPIFHSEADFQHGLAWLIHEMKPESEIRLEYPINSVVQKPMHLDIWLPTEEIATELKYRTQRLEIDCRGELYSLRPQGAQNQGSYDFLNDITRIEQAECRAGLAVLLTNDPRYWRPPSQSGTMDADFRIHEGRKVTGRLAWAGNPKHGTIKDREDSIYLKGAYTMCWHDYASFPEEQFGEFGYLAVSVEP